MEDCIHDWTGDTYYTTSSGKTIYWHTYREWASYTNTMREPLIHQRQLELQDPVIISGVTCKKCGSLFNPLKHVEWLP